MKGKDFMVSGIMPNGTVLQVKCELRQIGSVKQALKANGFSDFRIFRSRTIPTIKRERLANKALYSAHFV